MENLKTCIQKANVLLKTKKSYSQRDVVEKLRAFDCNVSASLYSNVKNNKVVGLKSLESIERAIRELIKLELGFIWNETEFIPSKEPTGTIIVPPVHKKDFLIQPGFAFHQNGRLSIDQKLKFMEDAQKEIIEFGISLNTFSTYFEGRSDYEFKNRFLGILQRGIVYKSYLLEPGSQESRIYYDDRNRAYSKGFPVNGNIENEQKIMDAIKRIKRMYAMLEEYECQEKYELYSYRHLPNCYFLCVDGSTPQGKMLVSHYIYGEKRANCPVVEINKSQNKDLYRMYWKSLQLLTAGSKCILPEKNPNKQQ